MCIEPPGRYSEQNLAADSPNPNSIVQRRSTDGGQTWGPMTTIAQGFVGDADTGKYGWSDPSYVVDSQAGKVFAFFVRSLDASYGPWMRVSRAAGTATSRPIAM